ncbi:hypothetical protein [Nocardia paucivorans]|uniref:hypothetical protein n=1 Tax=Nocardia paucivorans TaxID=114259 RepID=UPI00278BDCD0|nr:hypothetical protein [Nocardia paucivorans]
MTAMWFGLAAITLVGAIVLLYFDRRQRQRTGHARQVWAKAQGYTYVSVEPALASTWRRGALAKLGYLTAVDVVTGIRKGEKFVLLDLEDSATLVAVRRQIGSDIDVDMRLKTASPPKDADLELLGAIGDRVVFATNPEIARHAVDQRMVAFIESLPDTVQMLWSEGNWTLGMLPVGSAAKDWETGIDIVLRLSGLLHVLPPVADPPADREPPRPHPRARVRSAEHDERDAPPPRRGDKPLPARERDSDEDQGLVEKRPAPPTPSLRFRGEDDSVGGDGRGDAGQPRRPNLALVPDIRAEDRPSSRLSDRPASGADRMGSSDDDSTASERPRDEDRRRPGGPFHPGFRPYQGPVPR